VLEKVGVELALECRERWFWHSQSPAMGSRFQVLVLYTAKLLCPVDVRVHGTKRAPETAERD